MILDNIARRSDAVVVPGATANADVFGHRDLHMVDIRAVPDRFEQSVGEAQRKNVLHRLLAEVMVDAEDRIRREDVIQRVAQLPCAFQIVTEGLLDHHSTPLVTVPGRQSGTLELPDDHWEELRRDRRVERVVAAGTPYPVEIGDGARQRVEGVVVVEVSWYEAKTFGELSPHLLAEWRASVLLDRVVHDFGEVF